MEYYNTSRQLIDISSMTFEGRVLDIGGGGEGIISRHSGGKVIAIDCNLDELIETPDIGLKVVMDACQLNFLNDYFDTITCFYSLMYMDLQQIELFLNEAYRVLKSGAKLWIWDATIPANKKADVYIAQLQIKVSEQLIVTAGYGVLWDREHSLNIIRNLCEKAGFYLLNGNESDEAFSLCLCKAITSF